MKVIIDNLEIFVNIVCIFSVTSFYTNTIITGLGVLVGILLIVVITCFIIIILLLLYVRKYVEHVMFLVMNIFISADSNHYVLIQLKEQTVGKLSYFCYLVLIHIMSIYRPDEDIEMKVCEPYSLHQSKPNDGIYDECEPPVDTNVYESM